MARKAKINRNTKETTIVVEANLDGSGSYKVDTKIDSSQTAVNNLNSRIKKLL